MFVIISCGKSLETDDSSYILGQLIVRLYAFVDSIYVGQSRLVIQRT